MAKAAMPEAAADPESFDDLTRALRGSLASLRAAAETLELFPRMDESQQQRLRGVISGEAERLGELVDRLERLGDARRATLQPAPAEWRKTSAGEIAAAIAARAAARLGLRIDSGDSAEAPAEAAVEVEIEALLPALVGLLEALRDEFAVTAIQLRRKVVEQHAVFDLLWTADPASLDRLRAWQSETLEKGRGGAPGLRPVARRHGGEAWFNLDRDATGAYLRLLLPLAG